MVQNNEFMLVFRFEPNFGYQPTEEEQKAMHQQWGAFIGGVALQEKLVSTHQLGFDGVQLYADGSQANGIAIHSKQTLGGNMVVKANSMEEVIQIAKQCPILAMGGNVEIRSINQMSF